MINIENKKNHDFMKSIITAILSFFVGCGLTIFITINIDNIFINIDNVNIGEENNIFSLDYTTLVGLKDKSALYVKLSGKNYDVFSKMKKENKTYRYFNYYNNKYYFTTDHENIVKENSYVRFYQYDGENSICIIGVDEDTNNEIESLIKDIKDIKDANKKKDAKSYIKFKPKDEDIVYKNLLIAKSERKSEFIENEYH